MAQILQPYKIPVVFNDLSPEETMGDAFYALETLSATIDDIFGRIEKRLTDERRRVDHIRNRVTVCKSKVDQVRGSKKATTVFSTAKFPAPKTLPSYPTLFSQMHELRSPFREVDEEVQYTPPHPALSVVGNKELYGELQDIVLRLNTHGTDLERVEFTMEDEGLGRLPHCVPSIGSLLLFNSNINPYKDYQTLDNLVSAGREKHGGEEDGAKQLASAPSTILSGDALPDIEGLDLTFKPSMGEMSSLALPENLPLDFIANIQFTAGLDLPSIAPSHHQGHKANYSLPQLTDGRTVGSANSSAYAPPPSAKAATTAAPSAAGPPPPPPPPPPAAARAAAPPPPPAVPPPAPAASAAGPPPPPPAPPAVPAPAAAATARADDEDSVDGPSAAGPTGGKPSFLDAIKGMGVSKLRSKEESAMAAAKVQKKVEQAKPLTMAEALKERLARRNGALSGKNEKEDKRRDSLVVQAARTQQLQQQQQQQAAPRAPAPSSSGTKQSSALLAVGFASVAANDNDEDDGAFGYAKPGFAKGGGSDTESDTVSEFSEDSRAYASAPAASTKPSFLAPPQTSKAAPAPAPPPGRSSIAAPAPTPPPQERRGTGLLDSSNKAVASMLSQSQARAQQKASDGSDDDDWD